MHEKVFRALNLSILKNFHSTFVMGKKKNACEAKNKNSEKKEPLKNSDRGAVYLGKNSEIIVKVHAKPGAKESAITEKNTIFVPHNIREMVTPDIGNEAVGVQIGAPPVDGEANKELIRYLAEILNLRKSDISLDKGSRSKEKTVIITKDASLDNVLDALKAASKQ